MSLFPLQLLSDRCSIMDMVATIEDKWCNIVSDNYYSPSFRRILLVADHLPLHEEKIKTREMPVRQVLYEL